MHTTIAETSTLTVIISTIFLLIMGSIIVYYVFLHQRKKYIHRQDVMQLRETFNQTLLQSKLEIQEQTLDHIAKELHANFAHIISLININMSTVPPGLPEEAIEKIRETKSLAKQLMIELKALIAGFNTDHIMHVGFLKALENELKRLDRTRQYHIIWTKTGHEYKLPSEKEIILFRMCQEILNNIVKHADAKTITINLKYEQPAFMLVISDDGKGFDHEKVKTEMAEKQSTGIRNIYSRARLISANTDIQSTPGAGTSVSVILPINNNN